MLDKYDYIEGIITDLKGTTDLNFQIKIGEVLKVYCKSKKLTYEMPNSSGGDDKNDGWIVELKRFYQIYSPQQLRDSLKKDIQKKFTEDLDKLLELLYVKGKWNGEIDDFIFIVNTIDRNLPHDSERYFESERIKFEGIYNISFNVEVVNVDYIRDLLEELNLNELSSLSSRLKVKSIIDYNAMNSKLFYEFIDILNESIQNKFRGKIKTNSSDYKRLSSPSKITKNNLNDVEEEIEDIMLELHLLEEIVSTVYQDINYTDKFERVVSYIIQEYQDLSQEFAGVELYKKIIDNLIKFVEYRRSFEFPAKMLIVYIFDKCDIFEKEEVSVKV
ncbi:hypothetical protein [Bacillus subtilis]|uniref:hypothetical protein n=1 Tax=Bacillus subtilis TaxID=1423 RepID=UPI000F493B09|nr:hypothetical protein [Bacillus subtilis]MCL6427220.1 hypothetical protein [Bacillus subtilis]ROT25047.1 hypothetical protein EGD80_20655 [Bacillus subtilis]TAH79886.1 hypothetical protein ES060_17305 [Bacillus subtilis]TAH86921.1 hypothetical protein ES066_17310 [Bacillus subtilis]